MTLQRFTLGVSPISTFVGRYCDKLAILLFAVLVAGDALLSRVVNAAIGIKPLFAVMKVAAKQVLKSTAERNGVPWDSTVQQLQNTPEVLYICKPVTRSCTLSHPASSMDLKEALFCQPSLCPVIAICPKNYTGLPSSTMIEISSALVRDLQIMSQSDIKYGRVSAGV